MKKTIWIAAALAWPLLVACGGKSESAKEPADSVAQEAPAASDGPMADADWSSEATEKIDGHEYKIYVKRTADKEQPTLSDEQGRPYYDNEVNIKIERDGSDFYSKTFRKEAFLDFLSASDRRTVMLLGIAYDCVGDEGLRFGAQLGQPGSESGPIFTLTIATDGTASITKDFTQDTTGQE